MTSSTSSSSSRRARALVAALLLGGGAASAQAPTGTITGAVTDAASGRPIAGALVVATSPQLPGERSQVTGADGAYRLADLPPGRYRLVSQVAGYQPAERGDLQVKADVTLHADLVAVPEVVRMDEVVIQVPRPPPPPPPKAEVKRRRVVVLPPDNLSGGALPARDVFVALERMAAMAGAEVVGGDQLNAYLSKYRIRHTGGVDPVAAKAAREELGAEAILVTTVELWTNGSPPRIALGTRLVSTTAEVPVLWMDGWARTGDDSPGIFGLGIVRDVSELQVEAMRDLGQSLARYLDGGEKPERCSGGGWFRPRLAYRSQAMPAGPLKVAVLPFLNQTHRRGAGEVVALEMARQFEAAGGFTVVEPGVVRDELLRRRIVMDDGVSLDQARTMLATLDADLVVAGSVFDLDDAAGDPYANFSALVIDRKTRRMVWESTSYDRGRDSGSVFGIGVVSTAPRLACRMSREIVDAISGATALPRR